MLDRLARSSGILVGGEITINRVRPPLRRWRRAILLRVTLVLLTPIGLDAGCWERVPLPAVATVKHVFPGFGGRPRALQQPTMASLADEVAASYEGPLALAGVSLGGMVAQHVALRHPARVRSLLVACTGASADPATMAARAANAEANGMTGVLGETLERWFTPAALALHPEHPGVAYARRTLLALQPACFADGWRAIGGHDALARLGAIAVPTTCLAGSADGASPVSRTREISERVPGARLVVLDGPHMMHLERPEEFGAALSEHLSWAEERERAPA
jgi:3-oxoadipate enol-lactonase